MKHFLPISLTILFLISGCSKSENSNIPEDSSLEIFLNKNKNSFWIMPEESREIPFERGGSQNPVVAAYFPYSQFVELTLNENANSLFKVSDFWDVSAAYERNLGLIYRTDGTLRSVLCADCQVTDEDYFTNCSTPSRFDFDNSAYVATLSSDYNNTLIVEITYKNDDSTQEFRFLVDDTISPRKLSMYRDGELQGNYLESSKPAYCN